MHLLKETDTSNYQFVRSEPSAWPRPIRGPTAKCHFVQDQISLCAARMFVIARRAICGSWPPTISTISRWVEMNLPDDAAERLAADAARRGITIGDLVAELAAGLSAAAAPAGPLGGLPLAEAQAVLIGG